MHTSPPLKSIKQVRGGGRGGGKEKQIKQGRREGSQVSNSSSDSPTSSLFSPEIGLQNRKEGEGNITEKVTTRNPDEEGDDDDVEPEETEEISSSSVGQHIQTLASWELDLPLGEKANKGPMLFAREHLEERLKVKEGRLRD